MEPIEPNKAHTESDRAHRENGVDTNSKEAVLADLFHDLKNIPQVESDDAELISKRVLEANKLYVAIQEVAKGIVDEQDRNTVLRRAKEVMDIVMANKEHGSNYLVAN